MRPEPLPEAAVWASLGVASCPLAIERASQWGTLTKDSLESPRTQILYPTAIPSKAYVGLAWVATGRGQCNVAPGW